MTQHNDAINDGFSENNLQKEIEKTPHQKVPRSPESQGSTIPVGWTPTFDEPIPPQRCNHIFKATHERAGQQCNRWSLRGAKVCPVHGAQLPNVQKNAEAMVEYGRNQLLDFVPKFIDILIDIAENSESDAVRLGAVKDGLDRVGLKAGLDLNITVEHKEDPTQGLLTRLQSIQTRAIEKAKENEEITDAEIVPDE